MTLWANGHVATSMFHMIRHVCSRPMKMSLHITLGSSFTFSKWSHTLDFLPGMLLTSLGIRGLTHAMSLTVWSGASATLVPFCASCQERGGRFCLRLWSNPNKYCDSDERSKCTKAKCQQEWIWGWILLSLSQVSCVNQLASEQTLILSLLTLIKDKLITTHTKRYLVVILFGLI